MKQSKIQQEQELYNLLTHDSYLSELQANIDQLERKFKRYNYTRGKMDTSTRNMLKALRMLPRLNTPSEWARLHATEIFYKG